MSWSFDEIPGVKTVKSIVSRVTKSSEPSQPQANTPVASPWQVARLILDSNGEIRLQKPEDFKPNQVQSNTKPKPAFTLE